MCDQLLIAFTRRNRQQIMLDLANMLLILLKHQKKTLCATELQEIVVNLIPVVVRANSPNFLEAVEYLQAEVKVFVNEAALLEFNKEWSECAIFVDVGNSQFCIVS